MKISRWIWDDKESSKIYKIIGTNQMHKQVKLKTKSLIFSPVSVDHWEDPSGIIRQDMVLTDYVENESVTLEDDQQIELLKILAEKHGYELVKIHPEQK